MESDTHMKADGKNSINKIANPRISVDCWWYIKGFAAADQRVRQPSHLFFQQERVGCLSTRLPAV